MKDEDINELNVYTVERRMIVTGEDKQGCSVHTIRWVVKNNVSGATVSTWPTRDEAVCLAHDLNSHWRRHQTWIG